MGFFFNPFLGNFDYYKSASDLGAVTFVNGLTGVVLLTGTANRITISAANVFDISASYVGQSSITTVGTLSSGAIPTTLLTGVLQATQFPALTGDITTVAGALGTNLASIIAAGGPIGSATVAPIITYDVKGRLTAVSSATITPAASSITGGAALTKTDDTNVTLTLGGTPSTALLVASSLTLGWTGTLAVSRGGTGGGSASITLFNNITGFSATGTTGTTSTNLVFSTSPVFITPTLGVASATSLATSASSPLLLTNGKLVTIALTTQTVNPTTLTIPDFASVSDTFTFNTLAATLLNKTLDTSVGKGTWTASGTWTLPAHTVNGNLTLSAVNIVTDTTTGTKFGTATNQKIGFYNSTPIVQPIGDVITGLQNLGLIASATITVTTNANLTGPITSVGNATSIASQTGTGTKFVVDTSPTIITPTFTTNFTSPLWKPASDSTTALQMTASNGTTVLINVDSTNSRIGFSGVTAPIYTLDIGTSFAGETSMVATNTDAGTTSFAGIGTKNRVGSSAICRFLCMGTGWTTVGAFLQDSGLIQVGAAITNGLSILTSNAAGSIRFYTGGQNLRATFQAAGTLSLNSTIDTYNNITTTGWGVPAIYKSDRATAQTAAKSLAAYTVGAADGSFLVSANVLVTASTLHNFTVTCTYTDEGNTSRTLTLQFSTIAGAFVTAITNAQGTVPYEGVPLHVRCKASTTITIASTGTFTTCTYNIEEFISQIG